MGLLPSLYRVVLKQQQPLLKAWEAEYDHPVFSFQAGKNSLHQIWQQAAAAEWAVNSRSAESASRKLHTGMVLWDLTDYYENVGASLRQREVDLAFPIPVATLDIQQYGGHRLLQHGQAVASCSYPTHGIVAGCTAATYHVQAYSGPGLSKFIHTHHHLALNVHVDDLCNSAIDKQEDKVVQHLVAGARDP